MLHSAGALRLLAQGRMAQTKETSLRQVKTCFGHWCLEFEYYLLFVIWSLEFLIY
jgi:hypothetical protein